MIVFAKSLDEGDVGCLRLAAAKGREVRVGAHGVAFNSLGTLGDEKVETGRRVG